MTEAAPLFARKVLGSLRPANRFCEEAIGHLKEGETVTIKLGKVTRNQKRRAFYWVLLHVASRVLQDRTDSPWDAESLHLVLKQKLRLGEDLKNHKGEVIGFKPRSTSDARMTETERSRWLDRVSNVLSHWTGVPAADLVREAREQGETT